MTVYLIFLIYFFLFLRLLSLSVFYLVVCFFFFFCILFELCCSFLFSLSLFPIVLYEVKLLCMASYLLLTSFESKRILRFLSFDTFTVGSCGCSLLLFCWLWFVYYTFDVPFQSDLLNESDFAVHFNDR